MKKQWMFGIVLALITTSFAAAAPLRSLHGQKPVPAPPAVTASADTDAQELSEVLAIPPEVPLGPPDLLKGYEQAMASTADTLGADVNRIAAAVAQHQITAEQGDYLCKEAYELATMQFQVLSGLHDMLAEQVIQAGGTRRPADSAPAKGLNGSSDHRPASSVNMRSI
jgi:hypothetical protein